MQRLFAMKVQKEAGPYLSPLFQSFRGDAARSLAADFTYFTDVRTRFSQEGCFMYLYMGRHLRVMPRRLALLESHDESSPW